MGAFDDIINAFSRFTFTQFPGAGKPNKIDIREDINAAIDAGIPISISQSRKTRTPALAFEHNRPTWRGSYMDVDPRKFVQRMVERPGQDAQSLNRGRTILDLIRNDPEFNYRTGTITVNTEGLSSDPIERVEQMGGVTRHESSHGTLFNAIPDYFHPAAAMEGEAMQFLDERYPGNYWGNKRVSAMYDEAMSHIAGARSPKDYPVSNPKRFADLVLDAIPGYDRERVAAKWRGIIPKKNMEWMEDQDRALTIMQKGGGVIEPGNIDLTARPIVKNPDGTTSTVRSRSFNVDGVEVLVPTVSDDGRIMSDEEALQAYKKTGKHLGIFSDPASANYYAQKLHEDYASGKIKLKPVRR